ncbi:MAG TPA: response regulator transcription factor [Candidatus Dormibacteraeota bacterium]|nr:response regulator transcription factor [Candidatus Dormibacteraeota bacterium]
MTVATAPVRVVIADDQTLFRSGLERLLADDARVEVVGLAANGEEAIKLVAKLKPDVVLMDLKMPKMDGIQATQHIAQSTPEVKVLMLTTFESDGFVLQALKAGASGYVLKDSRVESIVSSIIAVKSGERVMAGSVGNLVVGMLTGTNNRKELYDGLTARELEILKLIAEGVANKQIAFRLKISEKTVRNHVSNTYEKLQIQDRAQAALYAVRKGLVEA